MASFDAVNYSLRPNKTIQRSLVFEGALSLKGRLSISELVYIGMGSIWFTDFVLAHKLLGVKKSFSLEADDIGYTRAKFNVPYATVDVIHGKTDAELRGLLEREDVKSQPAMIWLDYDYEMNESVCDDMRSVIEESPPNTIFLVTFNGLGWKYGKPKERSERIKSVFGAVAPDGLNAAACDDEHIQDTLADLTCNFMSSAAQNVARPGGFVPAFRILYRDGAPMITAGGVLPAEAKLNDVQEVVNGEHWPGMPDIPIRTPHLTMKEAAALQAKLPCMDAFDREAVQRIGFDLEPAQVDSFQKYYLRYPAFAQIIS